MRGQRASRGGLRAGRVVTAAPRYSRNHSAEQRDCALYYVDCLDPATNYTTVLRDAYIGETARDPFTRFMEHLYEQPFGDTIVGKPRVDPRVFGSKDEVWAAEREAVERLRPVYNYEYNLNNPDRIPIPEARRQREERDRAKGIEPPTWDKAPRPERQAPQARPSRRVPRLSVKWSRRRNRAAVRLAVWAAFAVGIWLGVAHLHSAVPFRTHALASSLGAAVCAVVAVKFRRRLLVWALLGAAGVTLWLLLPALTAHLPHPVPASVGR
jgi:hypothetical protein